MHRRPKRRPRRARYPRGKWDPELWGGYSAAIAKQVREIATAARRYGWSDYELAAQASLWPGTVRAIIQGEVRTPSSSTLWKMKHAVEHPVGLKHNTIRMVSRA